MDNIIDIAKLQKVAKDTLVHDIGETLELLKTNISEKSNLYNEIIFHYSLFNRISRARETGIISYDQAEFELNSLVRSLMKIIDGISLYDVTKSTIITKNELNDLINAKLFRVSFLASLIHLYSLIEGAEERLKEKINADKKLLIQYLNDLGLGDNSNLVEKLDKGGRLYQSFLIEIDPLIKQLYPKSYQYFKIGSNLLGDIKDNGGKNFDLLINKIDLLPKEFSKKKEIGSTQKLQFAFKVDKYFSDLISKIEL